MLYFDEQVSHHLIDPIVARGIDVTTVNLLGHKGLSDPVQLLRATELGRVVVTHNVADFILLHEAWLAWSDAWDARNHSEHSGILVVHPVKAPSFEHMAGQIVDLLQWADSLVNRLFSWDAKNGWQESVERKLYPINLPDESGRRQT